MTMQQHVHDQIMIPFLMQLNLNRTRQCQQLNDIPNSNTDGPWILPQQGMGLACIWMWAMVVPVPNPNWAVSSPMYTTCWAIPWSQSVFPFTMSLVPNLHCVRWVTNSYVTLFPMSMVLKLCLPKLFYTLKSFGLFWVVYMFKPNADIFLIDTLCIHHHCHPV
jgi:hypothetical protein